MKTSLTIAPSTAVAVLSPEFDQARKLQQEAKLHMMAAAGMMVLMGIELKRLKKHLGETRGRKTRTASGISWGDLVVAELGITDDTASKYILMAEAAKSRVPIIQALETRLLEAPVSALPAAEQEQLIKAVRGLTDGQTAKEVMQDLGIAKQDPGANLTKGDRNKGGNSTKTVATPEEEAQTWFGSVKETLSSLRLENVSKWGDLIYRLPLQSDADTPGNVSLESLVVELESWLEVANEAKAKIAKAMHASKEKDATKREEQARALVLAEAHASWLSDHPHHIDMVAVVTAAKEFKNQHVRIIKDGALFYIIADQSAPLHESDTLIYEGPGKDATTSTARTAKKSARK